MSYPANPDPSFSSGGITHISVIELDFHHDSLDGFLKIFQDTEISISAFTTSKNIALLKSIHYSDNIKFYEYAGGSKYSFLRKQATLINASQVVFINTIANDFGAYLAIDKSVTTVLRVHNVNKQFSPLAHLFLPGSLFFAWKFSSYIARQIVGKGFLVFRPLINRRIRYFTFPDSSITAYVKQQNFTEDKKILPPIPLKIFIEADTAFKEFSETLHITIIGATDRRRRQYEEVTEAMIALYQQANAPAINLTLLGNCNNAYGKSIIEKLSVIKHSGFSLKTYSSQVPETDFITCIRNTHLIISPITDHATTDIFKEIYGKTKTTGSILDFLKFGKVTLVPAHYSPPAELLDYIIKYKDAQHLSEIILDLLQSKKINGLNEGSLAYIKKNYSQQAVLKNTLAIFTSIAPHE